MSEPAWTEVSRVFQSVCDLRPDERAAALFVACGDDEALRAAVDRLLALDASDGAMLDGRPEAILLDGGRERDGAEASGERSNPASERAEEPTRFAGPGGTPGGAAPFGEPLGDPVRVGPYAIVEELGRGGMGVVHRARQERPRRDVALKLIDTARVGPGGLRRFRTEAELLGRLQHPGIAQIFEAGTATAEDADGRTRRDQPFIAMELVDGVPLSEAARDLDRRARIAVLAEICDAIAHAHQRSVVHLDLKPANILVDAAGRPRVLDFGVALALDVDLERTLGGFGRDAVAGTLAYMSPEQVAGETERIDTRADVHALGVIGYELLTGQTPYDIRPARLIDAMQIVLTAAPRPIRTIDASVDDELAAVIDRAVDAAPDGRYGGASAFAGDLRRWLQSEPVAGRPPSRTRSLRLFARRHRPLVVASLLGAIGVVGGVTALSVGFVQANAAEVEATELAAAARAEAEKARAMSTFMEAIIFGLDPESAGPDLSFFDAIDFAAERVHDDLSEYPDLEASVRASLGTVYRRHALYDRAEGQLRQSLRLRREHLGDEDPDTARAMQFLSNLVFERDGQMEEALMLLERADAIMVAATDRGPMRSAWVALDLGLVHLARDAPHAAAAAFQRCFDALSGGLGAEHPDTSRALRGLAAAALLTGEPERAARLAEQAVSRCTGLPAEAYLEARARLVLGEARLELGDVTGAEAAVLPAVAIFERLVAPQHARRGELDRILTRLRRAQLRLDAAAGHADHGLEVRETLLRPGHPDRIEAGIERLAVDVDRLVASVEATNPADAPSSATAADLDARAEALFTDARARLGPDHRLTIQAASERVRVLRAADDRRADPVADDLERRRVRRAERLAHTAAGDA